MGLEVNANYINDLNEDWPLGNDSFGGCDDHIRLIKQTTLQTFVNFREQLTNTPIRQKIEYTVEELNFMQDILTGQKIDDVDSVVYLPATEDGSFYVDTVNSPNKITVQKDLPPLMQVFEHVATEQELNEYYGVTYTGPIPDGPLIFMRCDGQDVPDGTPYRTLTGNLKVPDLTKDSEGVDNGGSYLGYYNDFIIGDSGDKFQPNTAYNSSSYPMSNTLTVEFNPSDLDSAIQQDPGHNHSKDGDVGYGTFTADRNCRSAPSANAWETGNSVSGADGKTRYLGYSTGQHTHAAEQVDLTVDFTGAGTETRPNSILVNYFIRVR